MRWIDNHCHLDVESAPDQVAAAHDAGVARLITVGTSVARAAEAIELARGHDQLWATVGVHPHEASDGIEGLEALLGEPEVVAVGECGLDYHYDHSPREDQRRVFAEQIALANAHDLPLMIHTRSAWHDTFDVLDAEGVPERTVLHCFTGGPEEARKCLDRGAHLSFSGIITFKTADDLRAAAELCPLDRLLIETDSPYLTPVPHRGKPNQPANVVYVGHGVAAVKNMEPAEIAASTWDVASVFYRLDE